MEGLTCNMTNFFQEYNILIVLSSCLLYPIMVIHSLFIIEVKCVNNVNNFLRCATL